MKSVLLISLLLCSNAFASRLQLTVSTQTKITLKNSGNSNYKSVSQLVATTKQRTKRNSVEASKNTQEDVKAYEAATFSLKPGQVTVSDENGTADLQATSEAGKLAVSLSEYLAHKGTSLARLESDLEKRIENLADESNALVSEGRFTHSGLTCDNSDTQKLVCEFSVELTAPAFEL